MARQEGLEPPAYCLEGSCSILLSYWRVSSHTTKATVSAVTSQRGRYPKHTATSVRGAAKSLISLPLIREFVNTCAAPKI